MRHAPITGSRDARSNAASANIFPSSRPRLALLLFRSTILCSRFSDQLVVKVNSQSVIPENSFDMSFFLCKYGILFNSFSRREITKRLIRCFNPVDSSKFFQGGIRTRKRPTATRVPDCHKKQRMTRAASLCTTQEALNCKVFLIYLSNRDASEHGETQLVTFRRCTGRT